MSEQNYNEQNNNTVENDEKMAIKFPDWDLLPPDVLLKRHSNNDN